MKKYRIKICMPCENNRWQGKIVERYIEAANLNYVIMRGVTVEEIRSGARIVEIWEQSKERGILETRIK